MWKNQLTGILLLLILNSSAQNHETWWTIYGGTQLLPGTVYISARQPAIGYGSGHTILFRGIDKPTKKVWMGIDFNHHYFGRKKLNDFKVFYESWQLAFLTRVTVSSARQFTPYIDLSGGLRLLISFTANSRTYAGLLTRRWIDLITFAASGADNDPLDVTDHKVIRQYDRLMPVAGIGAGFWLSNKKKDSGLNIKGSINFGTASKYADYREIKNETDTYNYIISRGSGAFFNLQMGYSFRLR